MLLDGHGVKDYMIRAAEISGARRFSTASRGSEILVVDGGAQDDLSWSAAARLPKRRLLATVVIWPAPLADLMLS